MLGLAFATMRRRLPSLVGSVLALLFAAVLVTACGVLMETGLRAQIRPERYGAAPVVVAGPQSTSILKKEDGPIEVTESVPLEEPTTIPASLAADLAKVSGVREVVPDLTFPVGLLDADGRAVHGSVYGHGWESARLTPYTLRAGRAPASPDEIVLDAVLADAARLKVGTTARVLGRDGLRAYTVAGIAGSGSGVARQPAVFFSAPRAAELFGHQGRVSAFGVFGSGDPERLKDRIDAALPRSENATGRVSLGLKGGRKGGDAPAAAGPVTYAGDERGFGEEPRSSAARETLVVLSGSLGGIAVMVAAFVVAGTFGLALRQRGREIALLRAIGATPAQVRSMTGKEALLIGAVASAAGVPAGVAAGRWMFGELVSKGMIPDAFPLTVGPVPMLVAVALGTATAWLSARGAVRRATRIRPTEALGEAAAEPRALGRVRAVTGLVFLALGTALCGLSMFMTGETAAMSAGGIVILLTVAAALLGPWLVRVAVALVGGALGRASRVGGYLAVANTRTGARSLAAVVSPLTLMLAFAGTTVFTQSTIGHATERQAAEGMRADYVVSSAGPGVPADAAHAVRALPGVAGVTEVIDTRVIGHFDELGEPTLRPYGALGLTVPAHGLDLDVRAGSLDRLRGDAGKTVALSTLAAGSFGASVGDRVRLRLGDGTPITPTVVAVYDRGLGFGDVALPYDLVRAHTASGMADRLLVVGDGSVRSRLAAVSPGLTVTDRAGAKADRDAAAELNDWVNLLALGLIIVFIAISVVNTLVMATAGRVREFALLRLVGGTRRQVLGVIRWEALLVGGVALVVGTAIAVPTLAAVSYGLTGSAIPHVRPAVLAAMVAATLGLAFAATLLPARAALAGRPADRVRG
ncbi:FtsX-like permease family protein [Microtetraspora fusca]|uniref:FtsX-like permease family protein n=1 Tax=Microtetraspora fusca TaxID=1997 RepID=UPI0008347A74|nr:FtsX-like permease family protein [Microtetraspora fusca]